MKKKIIRINLGITKIYLIPCRGGYLLIDTGYENDYKKFIKILDRENVDINSIKYLLITHYHDDHAGFAQLLKEKYGIKLIVQKKSIPLLAKGDSGSAESEYPINKPIKWIMNGFMLFHKEFTFPPVIITDTDIVIDGDNDTLLYSLGVQGKIYATPGHTSDSMSVIMDNGDAFLGDAAMNFMMVAGAKHRPIYVNDIDAVFKSWEKIIKSGAKTIYPAHGNPFSVQKLIPTKCSE